MSFARTECNAEACVVITGQSLGATYELLRTNRKDGRASFHVLWGTRAVRAKQYLPSNVFDTFMSAKLDQEPQTKRECVQRGLIGLGEIGRRVQIGQNGGSDCSRWRVVSWIVFEHCCCASDVCFHLISKKRHCNWGIDTGANKRSGRKCVRTLWIFTVRAISHKLNTVKMTFE